MCTLPISFVLLSIRLLSFGLGLALLPLGVVPFSIRILLALSVILFFSLGLLDGGCSSLYAFLMAVPDVSVTFSHLMREVVFGLLFAVVVSAAAFAAELCAAWFSQLLFSGVQSEREEMVDDGRIGRHSRAIRGITVLFFLVIIFSSDFAESGLLVIVTAFAAFDSTVHFDPSNIAMFGIGVKTIAAVSQQAFLLALVFVVPLFCASLLVDFGFLVANRYLQNIADNSLVLSAKIPLLVLVFSISMYSLTSEVQSAFDYSVTNELRETVEKLSTKGARTP